MPLVARPMSPISSSPGFAIAGVSATTDRVRSPPATASSASCSAAASWLLERFRRSSTSAAARRMPRLTVRAMQPARIVANRPAMRPKRRAEAEAALAAASRGLARADVGTDLLLRLQRDADVLVGEQQRGVGGGGVAALHRREELLVDRGVVLAVGFGRAAATR